jgi:hypothetical protein
MAESVSPLMTNQEVVEDPSIVIQVSRVTSIPNSIEKLSSKALLGDRGVVEQQILFEPES